MCTFCSFSFMSDPRPQVQTLCTITPSRRLNYLSPKWSPVSNPNRAGLGLTTCNKRRKLITWHLSLIQLRRRKAQSDTAVLKALHEHGVGDALLLALSTINCGMRLVCAF